VEATPKELHIYMTASGELPFNEWLASLRDSKARAKIRVRLDRVSLGNMGDCHGLGDGIQELRIDYGPGYRMYFGQLGSTIVRLLWGGDKSTQAADIDLAKHIGLIFGGAHEKEQGLSSRLGRKPALARRKTISMLRWKKRN
jgi:putative addiction module killer protein